jgi:anti-sigma regulatory factor (Ser/Thr protein kinase)
MVSLLWEAGDIPGAIELEKLWNELGDQMPFSLLCGYPSSSLSDPRHAHALDRVCALHSAALSARSLPCDSAVEASLPFPAQRNGPRAARQFIDHVLWDWGYDRTLVEDARLVISELTTNVVLHAGSPFRVGVRIEGDELRLSVRDESLRRPHVLALRPDEPHGRGLRVVAAVADDWGVEFTANGKTVWATLRSEGAADGQVPA